MGNWILHIYVIYMDLILKRVFKNQLNVFVMILLKYINWINVYSCLMWLNNVYSVDFIENTCWFLLKKFGYREHSCVIWWHSRVWPLVCIKIDKHGCVYFWHSRACLCIHRRTDWHDCVCFWHSHAWVCFQRNTDRHNRVCF